MLELERAIVRVCAQPDQFAPSVASTGRRLLRATWVLPSAATPGRAHILAAAAEVHGLRSLGLPAQLAVPGDVVERVPEDELEDAVVFENEQQLSAVAEHSDVLVAAVPDALGSIIQVRPQDRPVLLACTVRALPQSMPDVDLDGIVVMTPSRWLHGRLNEQFSIPAQQYELSADARYFHPGADQPTADTRLQIAAWLRPATAVQTLTLMQRLHDSLAPGASLVTFGASLAALDRRGAPDGPWRQRHLGALGRDSLARMLGQTDIVLDLTRNMWTGELAAAAMACGVVPVVDASSSAAELIDNDRNGIVIDSADPADWHDAIAAIDHDWPRLRALQTAALQTATQRSPQLTAISQYTVLERAMRGARLERARRQVRA
jgi:hypothetical protein